MELERDERIIIPDEKGEEHLFEVLFSFDVDQTGNSYISVVPADQKEGEEAEVFTFRFDEEESNDDDLALYHIDSDEEWEMVDEVLHTLTGENLI
ncbi:Uncharacterized protein YrzB, UPF0473 family [Thalassobacillus cyri]|uniref:UPF0473 protein SAMN05421743_10180 n=1 Tax=Thalassobacillus cyri TaxID=571932 RepID=A0A1H3VLL8_9BACI|nr:DUF1292 domain-containing protein [Thalassobacillus cyri]SDZ75675.1 Uncharacterized protein YrzB, UPF0473 family [Thalassobacillus cyri]